MKIPKIHAAALLSLVLATLGGALTTLHAMPLEADAQGHLRLSGAEHRVYDLSDTYSQVLSGQEVAYTLTQDASGRLQGAGTVERTDPTYGRLGRYDFKVTGKVGGNARKATLSYTVTGSGEVLTSRGFKKFSFVVSLKGNIDRTHAAFFSGAKFAKLCVEGAGCEQEKAPAAGLLPPNTTWEVMFDVAAESPGGGGVAGAAVLTTSNGTVRREFSYDVTSKAKNGVHGLRLSPHIPSKPILATAALAIGPGGIPTAGEVLAWKGSILGQEVRF